VARNPFADLIDPSYIGTGPGAARRRYEIRALADEIARAVDRGEIDLHPLGPAGRPGGGVGGFFGRLLLQGANVVGNLPASTLYLGKALGQAALTTGPAGAFIHLPGASMEPSKEIAKSAYHSILADIHDPIGRPGYLLADVASFGLPAISVAAKAGLAGRVALRGSEALRAEQPMMGATVDIIDKPTRRRAARTKTGKPAAPIPGETIVVGEGRKEAALTQISKRLGGTAKEEDYIAWLGDQGEEYVTALRDQPTPPFVEGRNAKGYRTLEHIADNGDKIEIQIPKTLEQKKGHMIVSHHPKDPGSATGFGKPTPIARVPVTEESTGLPLAHFAAETSAKDLALRELGHREVKSDFGVTLSHEFREQASVPLEEVVGQAAIQPAGSEAANVLGGTHYGGISHGTLDKVKSMMDRGSEKRPTKPETVQTKLKFDTVEEAQAAMETVKARAAEAEAFKADIAAKEGITGQPAEEVLAQTKGARQTQEFRAASAAAVRAEEASAEAVAREEAARGAMDVAGEPIKDITAVPELVAHGVQRLRDKPTTSSSGLFNYLDKLARKAGLPGLHPDLSGEVLRVIKEARAVAEGVAAKKPGEGIMGVRLGRIKAAARREAAVAYRENSAISADRIRGIIAKHHPEGVDAPNAQLMNWVRASAEKTRAGEPAIAHPIEQSHGLVVEAARQIRAANKGIEPEALRKQATEVAKSIAEERGIKGRKGARTTLPRTIKTGDFMEAVTGEAQVAGEAALRPWEHFVEPAKVGDKKAASALGAALKWAKNNSDKVSPEETLRIQNAVNEVRAAKQGQPPPQRVTSRTKEFAKAGVRESKREDLDLRIKRLEADAKKRGQIPTREEYETIFAQTLGPKMGPKQFAKWEDVRGPVEEAPPVEERPARGEERVSRRTEGTSDRERRINPRELKAAGVPDDLVGPIANDLRGLIDDWEGIGRPVSEIDPYDYADVFVSHMGEEAGQAAFMEWGGPSGGAPGGEPLGYRLKLAARTFVSPPSPGVFLHGYETIEEKLGGGQVRQTRFPKYTLKSRSPVVRVAQRVKYNMIPKMAPKWFRDRVDKHIARETLYIQKMVETNYALSELRKNAVQEYEAAGRTGPTPDQIIKRNLQAVVDETYEKWVNSGRKGSWTDFVDTTNQMAVIGALMLKPAYLGANLLGQLEAMMVDHAWNPISVARASILQNRVSAKYPELEQETIFGAKTAGYMESFGFQRGLTNKFGRGVNVAYRQLSQEGVGLAGRGFKRRDGFGVTFGKGGKVYPAAEKVLDNPWRKNAFYNEARRQGFRTPEAIHELMTSESPFIAGQRLEIFSRANKNAIEYGRLSRTERDFVRRIVFFYPWIKASTRWTGRTITEHPFATGLRMQGTPYAREQIQKDLGFLPSFMLGAFKVGDVYDKALGKKLPLVFNPAAVATAGSAAQLMQTGGEMLGGYETGTAKLAQYLNPGFQSLITQTTGYDPFTGRSIPESEDFQLPFIGDRLPGVPGALGGRALNTFFGSVAPASTVGDIKRLQALRSGEHGDVSKVLLPMTPAERFGRYLGPGLGAIVGRPFGEYRYNPEVGQEQAFREQVSAESTRMRPVYKHDRFGTAMLEAAREAGVLGPGENFPPEVHQALIARGRREGEIAEFKKRQGRPLTARETLSADVGLLVNMKQLNRQDAADLINESFDMADEEIKALDGELRDEYLGGGILSEYLAEINAARQESGKPKVALP
jgi:hypothetical protein